LLHSFPRQPIYSVMSSCVEKKECNVFPGPLLVLSHVEHKLTLMCFRCRCRSQADI
jgi:hypothetical protein